MQKYKLSLKDLSFKDFRVYLFALFKAFIPKKKIKNLDELESLNLDLVGPRLERNKSFPQFANIEFACLLEDKTIRMRVWERGAGVTMACGSGACATLVAASKLNKSSNANKIILDGGNLFIEWLNNGTVTLSGDTEKVYEGLIGG